MARLLREACFSGVGLHTGRRVTLGVRPAAAGIRFLREDLAGTPAVPAALAHVAGAHRCTALALGRARVRTVEHLLAALSACGVWAADCALDGPELPALDGGAAAFLRGLLRAVAPGPAPPPLAVRRPVSVRLRGSIAALLPAPELRVSLRVDVRGLGPQRLRGLGLERFARVADARTFVYAEEVAGLRRRGLARGGSPRNALVLRDGRPLNRGGLRGADEPVRHKAIDAIGDLALLGRPLRGHLVAVRPGHALVHALLRRALAAGALIRAG